MSSTRRSSRRNQSTVLLSQTFETPTKRGQVRSRKPIELSSSDENDTVEKHSTPPKQKRNNNATPKVVLSPGGSGTASLIMKLKLESPKSTKPKNNFQKARQILNTNETKNLPCREKEYEELKFFLAEHLTNKSSGSMYVSGPPGTGKTACLSKLLKSETALKYQKVYINCTSVTSIGHIYKDIAEELKLSDVGSKESIERFLGSNHKMILIVLDEVDQLIGKKQSILYTIFEWPSVKNSRLVLIGIANALDLTDRMLPRLNTKCGLKPELMHFAPYTKQQIVTIFTERLKEADVLDLFPPLTIQLLAGKVAAISGDVRRALDIGRRVVEIAEKQKLSSKNQKANIDLTELGIAPLDTNEHQPQPVEKVQMTQVSAVLNNVYGASNNLNEDIEDAFPLQQKIVICTLLLVLKFDKNKDVTVGRLHDVYKKICGKRSIAPLDQSEFYGLCDLVQTRGIMTLQKKKEPRQCKVALQWDEEEVNGSLKDKQLISSILSDVACLTK